MINTRKDFDALPEADQQVFKARLAGTIYGWSWVNGEWVQTTNTKTIERFGFTLDDFPDAPVQDKPTRNPDKDAEADALAEAEANRLQAYRMESDPLKLKIEEEALRTGADPDYTPWLDLKDEIRGRYPYPDGSGE